MMLLVVDNTSFLIDVRVCWDYKYHAGFEPSNFQVIVFLDSSFAISMSFVSGVSAKSASFSQHTKRGSAHGSTICINFFC